jgi:hypothetical protein
MLETEVRYLPFYFSDGTFNKFPFRDTHETLREYFARLSMALPGETLSHVVFDRRKLSDKDLDMTIQEFVAKMDSEGAEFRQMIGVKKKINPDAFAMLGGRRRHGFRRSRSKSRRSRAKKSRAKRSKTRGSRTKKRHM